jgi:hypothetical protein
MVGVHRRESLPLLGQIVFGKDSLNRTSRLASSTINAFIRMNIEHLRGLEVPLVFSGVYAINRANVNASSVFRSNTGFRYYIGHLKYSLLSDIK